MYCIARYTIPTLKNDFPFLRLPIFSRNVRPNDDDDDIATASQAREQSKFSAFIEEDSTSLLLMIAAVDGAAAAAAASTPLSLYNMIFSITSRTKVSSLLFFGYVLPISSSPPLSSYHHFSGWKVVQRQLFHPTFLSHGPFSIGSKRTKNCCKVSTILLASTGSNGFLLLIWFESKKSHHFVQLPPSNQPKENGARKEGNGQKS